MATPPSRPGWMRRAIGWAAFLLVAFSFRLLFGLYSPFFFEDETQIYLMGLQYYATGIWPYFGPDVVWTHSQIPGALQALLVGLPFHVAPIPEAPFVLLNLLSLAALALLAWYISARLPAVPHWLIWGWLCTAPWTLHYSTHIVNPSYVLPAAIVFFVGFFEADTRFRLGRLSPGVAFAMMGAGVAWVAQVHMSWPLLIPCVCAGAASNLRDGWKPWLGRLAACGGGVLAVGTLVAPTFLRDGLLGGSGGTLQNLRIHAVSPWELVTTLARLFSFASLEINRFVGTDGAERLVLFQRHLWLVPFAALVWAAGLWQPLWMLRESFRPRPDRPDWRAMRVLVACTVLIIYTSYFLVMQPPKAHAFYLAAPLAFIYAGECWSFIDSPTWRRRAAVILGANVIFHVGFILARAPEQSLYANRAVAATAIRLKQPDMLALRRPYSRDARSAAAAGWSPPAADPLRDVEFTTPSYSIGVGGLVLWRAAVHNGATAVAYRDILYQTTYRDPTGRVFEQRHKYIRRVWQPGETREVELNDGFVPSFRTASLKVLAAEPLIPLPR